MKTVSVTASKKPAMIVGFAWDKYTPKVEAAVVTDCMRLQGAHPHARIYAYLDKESTKAEEFEILAKLLHKIQVSIIPKMPPKPEWVQAYKTYYHAQETKPDLPEALALTTCKVFDQCMVPKLHRIKLRPGVTNYPHFRDMERMAPPGTLPQYKARPPSNAPAIFSLPLWALNN